MTRDELQLLCEQGQRELMATDYLRAERTLARAEAVAYENRWWETLARLYMPLQEARRQKRQRCGEGVVRLDLLTGSAGDAAVAVEDVLGQYPHGQLLVAGWGTIEPAMALRRAAAEREAYVETFLAATYPIGGKRAVVIVGEEGARLPRPEEIGSIDQLLHAAPAHSLVMSEDELPAGPTRGTPETFGLVMALWEKLHLPYLAAANAERDPVRKIAAYRRTTFVDAACELAHQRLADTARLLARQARGS